MAAVMSVAMSISHRPWSFKRVDAVTCVAPACIRKLQPSRPARTQPQTASCGSHERLRCCCTVHDSAARDTNDLVLTGVERAAAVDSRETLAQVSRRHDLQLYGFVYCFHFRLYNTASVSIGTSNCHTRHVCVPRTVAPCDAPEQSQITTGDCQSAAL